MITTIKHEGKLVLAIDRKVARFANAELAQVVANIINLDLGEDAAKVVDAGKTDDAFAVELIDKWTLGVSGVIEHWNWVEEDRETNLAPIAWADRYQDKLWSR